MQECRPAKRFSHYFKKYLYVIKGKFSIPESNKRN